VGEGKTRGQCGGVGVEVGGGESTRRDAWTKKDEGKKGTGGNRKEEGIREETTMGKKKGKEWILEKKKKKVKMGPPRSTGESDRGRRGKRKPKVGGNGGPRHLGEEIQI